MFIHLREEVVEKQILSRFKIVRKQDITMNVHLALKLDSDTKRMYMNKIPFGPFKFFWRDFFALRNSRVYRLIENKEVCYFCYTLEKKL
jgi:hypothetical protein